MRYYIADCHFFHESLNRQMDFRGFASGEEMNAYMLEKWNARVRYNDEVVVLGDLSLGKPEETMELLDKLNGQLCLIRGNHDCYGLKKGWSDARFKWIRDYTELRDNGRKVVLCHYPVFCYNGQFRTLPDGTPRTWMLYGHVHNTQDRQLVDSFVRLSENTVRYDRKGQPYRLPCQMINCFCMDADYTPLTLDEWIEKEKIRRLSLSL